jgi:hypothetical protein
LEEQYEEACAALGGEGRDAKPVEPKFGFALLEAASLENDDDLQDMFARLLANATTEGTGVEARRAFVSILSDLTPFDARLLRMIYDAPRHTAGLPIRTANLPDGYVEAKPIGARDDPPSKDVELSLWNLVRLGCVNEAGGWDGTSSVALVMLTELGGRLIEACTPMRNAPPNKHRDRGPYIIHYQDVIETAERARPGQEF